MLVKTKGVVLKFIKYRETSIIVNIYTEMLGLQSYVVNGIRSSRSKTNKIALYQPLSLLDLVVYYREGKPLHRLSEARCHHPFNSIPLNPKKSSVALFLVEVLAKTLKEQTENKPLFHFIWESLKYFDKEQVHTQNFHLVFMIKLAKYLGFAPQDAQELFNELGAEADAKWFSNHELSKMDQLLVAGYDETPEISNHQRANLLMALITLYQLHVEQFGSLKSVKVLNQVFR